MMHPQIGFISVSLLYFLASPTTASFIIRPEPVILPAKATGHGAIVLGSQPKVTPTPQARHVLVRRAAGLQGDDDNLVPTLTFGTGLCGYKNGDFESPYTCVASSRSCTNDGTYIGCCEAGSTCLDFFPTTCIDSTGFVAGLCNEKDSRTLCCSDSTQGFCQWLTSSELGAVACGSSHATVAVMSIPNGFTGSIAYETEAETIIPNQSIFAGASPTMNSGLSAIASGSSGSGSSDEGEDDGRPTTGAIVGSVVGAIIVFVVVIIGTVYFVHRKKGSEEDEDLSPTAPAPFVYCIPETAQTTAGSGSEYGVYYRNDGFYSPSPHSTRNSTLSSDRSISQVAGPSSSAPGPASHSPSAVAPPLPHMSPTSDTYRIQNT